MQKQFQCRIKRMILQFIPNVRKLPVKNLCGSTLASNFLMSHSESVYWSLVSSIGPLTSHILNIRCH